MLKATSGLATFSQKGAPLLYSDSRTVGSSSQDVVGPCRHQMHVTVPARDPRLLNHACQLQQLNSLLASLRSVNPSHKSANPTNPSYVEAINKVKGTVRHLE